jgi:hypothetical protein
VADRVIDNPIINSPYRAPTRHFAFDNDGITNRIVEARRESSYFVPVPRPRKRGAQQQLEFAELTADQIEKNQFVNEIRARVARGPRDGGQRHWLQALEDAIKFRQARVIEPCADCGSVVGKCEDHARDLDLIAEYHRTARSLIEGPADRHHSARGAAARDAAAGVQQPGEPACAAAGGQ